MTSSFYFLGLTTALFMFLSPITVIRRIIIEKSISEFSEVPYVVSMMSCVLWVAYGVATPGRILPMATNIVGLFCQVFYCATFLNFSVGSDYERIRYRIIATVFFLLFFLGFVFVVLPQMVPEFLNHDVSSTSTIGLFGAILNTGSCPDLFSV